MRDILNFVWQYLKKYKKYFTIFSFSVIFYSFLSILTPMISSSFIDFLISSDNKREIINFCIWFLLTNGFVLLIGYCLNRTVIKIKGLTSYDINKSVIKHVQKLDINFFENKSISNLTQQITTDVQVLINFVIELLQNLFANIFKILISTIIIFTLDWRLLILLFVLMLTYFIVYIKLKDRLYQTTFSVKEKQNEYYSKIYEQLSFVRYIKIHGLWKWFIQRMEKPFVNMFKETLVLQKLQYFYMTIDSFILSIGQIFLFIIGGDLVLKSAITVGEFTLVSTYYTMIITSFSYFFNIGKNIQNSKVSYDRIKKILDCKYRKMGTTKLSNIKYINIENLCFSFDNKSIFNNFSLLLKKGYTYAIVGENGIGKSTFIFLLIGIFDKYKGNIFFDNINLRDIDIEDLLQNKIAIVEQNGKLMHDTLYSNVYQSRMPSIELKTLMEYWDISDSIFNKKDCEIQSDNISEGEKQRIALARALSKCNADVYIFDESVSALDVSGVEKFLQLLDRLKENNIVIIISHSAKIIQHCDIQIRLGEKTVLTDR